MTNSSEPPRIFERTSVDGDDAICTNAGLIKRNERIIGSTNKHGRKKTFNYDDSSIKSLDWREHIRLRPACISELGDGSAPDDGIYVLIKEVVDNCIDEHMMGYGKQIEITIDARTVTTIRDYGRGIPLGKVVDVVSKINTGAKYDSKAFQRALV